MKSISGVLAPQCANLHCFKTKVQVVFLLVCKSCSFLCYWTIYQHSKTEFGPSLVTCIHSGLLFHPCFCTPHGSLCSPVQHEKCISRKWPTVCVSIRATPWVRLHALPGETPAEGLVILVPSAVLVYGTWASYSPLRLILLKCMNLNNLFLYKLMFEGSVQGKRALPGKKRGGNT